jgi:hypothetical protein
MWYADGVPYHEISDLRQAPTRTKRVQTDVNIMFLCVTLCKGIGDPNWDVQVSEDGARGQIGDVYRQRYRL